LPKKNGLEVQGKSFAMGNKQGHSIEVKYLHACGMSWKLNSKANNPPQLFLYLPGTVQVWSNYLMQLHAIGL